MDIGIKNAAGTAIPHPLPLSWLGRPDAPLNSPVISIPGLSLTNIKNLQAQIGYDLSNWNYSKIGNNHELGRYQFSTQLLEDYGVIAQGSNQHYGTDCVNYTSCWRPQTIRTNTSSYANYLYNVANLTDFLNSKPSQEYLAYQRLYDIYNSLVKADAIVSTDSADVIAGMIYVGWTLGTGAAYTWRYTGVGTGATAFNSGRYSVTVLSQ